MMFAAALNCSVSSDDGSLVVMMGTVDVPTGVSCRCWPSVFQWAVFKKTEYDV